MTDFHSLLYTSYIPWCSSTQYWASLDRNLKLPDTNDKPLSMHVDAQGALATATAAKTSLQRLRFFFEILSPLFRLSWNIECRWIFLELNSWGPHPSLKGERESCHLVFRSSIKSRLGNRISCRSRAVKAGKCTKKYVARAELLFGWSNLLLFWPSRCCHCRHC